MERVWFLGKGRDSPKCIATLPDGTIPLRYLTDKFQLDATSMELDGVAIPTDSAGINSVATWRELKDALKLSPGTEEAPVIVDGAGKVVALAGQQYGLPEDQAKVIAELVASRLEEKERKKTTRISSFSQVAWMEVQQKARLNLVWTSAEMEPTHHSDLPAFGWDDQIEKAQANRYIPHLNMITKSHVWTVIDAANKFPELLSCDLCDQHFTGTTDVAWVERRSVLSLPQTGLRCIFELKKEISSGAGHYQALISLLCANMHSQYKPFVILTDLVEFWGLYWVDESSIYRHTFSSRATAVGYIEDLLRDDGGGREEIPLGGGSLAVEGRQEKHIFKRQKLFIPEMSNLLDLIGSLPDEEIRSAQVECAVQSLLKIPALSSIRSEFSSPPEGMYG